MEKKPNRLYKARLFVMIFEDKRKLLELYNAISGKHYEDPELLEINTLENAIYMSMKNDLSFLIDAQLSLYEHQSTYSPNLSLRFFFYLSDMFSGMTMDANLYGTKRVVLPVPRFIVFYNGEADQPDRQILKLSDLYTVKEEEPMLDLKVLVLNVNQGHNPELMEACHTLWEYAEYTGRVRKYAKEQPIAFLEKNRREAKNVSIYEYDQEKHIRQEREEAWEAGEKAGWEAGREAGEKTGREAGERAGQINKLQEQIRKKLAKGKTIPEIAEALEEDEDTIRKLIEEMGI